MSAAENQPRPYPVAGVSMRDLLASCAAAEAVSRPPRAPEQAPARPVTRSAQGRRRAA
ncbi:hypothetical protein [Streptomyces sp. NRRL S-340]|uniref:hypothetical protein n=1 Tax=Streptomyces sp. NRRL S-340 TaxID=1463901 RepID=UPI000AE73F6D|nr:hypothetical protein [Streptomyces sp. NRRL S-340]